MDEDLRQSSSFRSSGVVQPPPPAAYWYEPLLQSDPGFDHDAAKRSAAAVPAYRERFAQEQKDQAPYPPRLVVNPMTALPALLNGYLPGSAPPAAAGQFEELAEQWIRDPAVSLAAFGLEPDVLFVRPEAGDHPRLERTEWLRSSLPQGDVAKGRWIAKADVNSYHTEAHHLCFQQWHAGRWPVYGGRVALHGGLNDSRVSLSSSFLPLRAGIAFEPKLDVVAVFKIATEVFRAEIKSFNYDTWRVVLVPYAGSEQFIIPFGERFRLAYRLEVYSQAGDDVWRIFIDAGDESGLVLGPIERLISQANAFYFETSAAAIGPSPSLTTDAVLSLAGLEAALAPYLDSIVDAATGLPLNLAGFPAPLVPPQVNTELEASNIAFHALGALSHFISACGADGARLLGYDYQYVELVDFGIDVQPVTVNNHQAPPLRLIVGHQVTGTLDMGFNPASGNNPKRVVFQSLPQPLDSPGWPRIFNPSLDPEVIQHEMVHAIMWLLNPPPFDEPNATVPFTRALLEGYASYFARSLSARHPKDPHNNPEGLWGSAAYREGEGWDDTWSFVRSSAVIGEDKLSAPNVYPGNATSGLPMYELGMVWARALWDLRVLLFDNLGASGLNLADTLALDGYYRCHGLIASFQVAAEGVLDSATQKGMSALLVQQIRDKFVARGICTS